VYSSEQNVETTIFSVVNRFAVFDKLVTLN
jgi:hypothetical protein